MDDQIEGSEVRNNRPGSRQGAIGGGSGSVWRCGVVGSNEDGSADDDDGVRLCTYYVVADGGSGACGDYLEADPRLGWRIVFENRGGGLLK